MVYAEKEFNVYVDVIDKTESNNKNNFLGFEEYIGDGENVSVQMSGSEASQKSGFGEFASLKLSDNIVLPVFILELLFLFIVVVFIIFERKKKFVFKRTRRIKRIR